MKEENPSLVFKDARGMVYKVAYVSRENWLMNRRRDGSWTFLRKITCPVELDAMMACELTPAEYSALDVRPIGRLFYLVRSSSRSEISHTVDMEPNSYGEKPSCSCESNRFRGCRCRHLAAVEEFVLHQTRRVNRPLRLCARRPTRQPVRSGIGPAARA